MPQALIAPLILAVSAATSAGLGIYSAVNQPGAPPQPTPAQVSKDAIASETANRQAAAKSAGQLLPGLQSDTNGGLSPDAYATLSSDFSGNGNIANSPQMQQLVAKFLGIDSGSSFGGSSSSFGSSFGGGGSNSITSPGLTG